MIEDRNGTIHFGGLLTQYFEETTILLRKLGKRKKRMRLIHKWMSY
jgi:hypothetical protein